jgi:hypothetical protein
MEPEPARHGLAGLFRVCSPPLASHSKVPDFRRPRGGSDRLSPLHVDDGRAAADARRRLHNAGGRRGAAVRCRPAPGPPCRHGLRLLDCGYCCAGRRRAMVGARASVRVSESSGHPGAPAPAGLGELDERRHGRENGADVAERRRSDRQSAHGRVSPGRPVRDQRRDGLGGGAHFRRDARQGRPRSWTTCSCCSSISKSVRWSASISAPIICRCGF